MSTIHSTLALPPKGTSLLLGPVRVSARYPADTTPAGKKKRNIMVTDSSGSSKMTLWGAAAEIPFIDGSTYTFKGRIGINEYNGTTSITAENVTAELSDGTAVTAATPASVSHNTSLATSHPRLDELELADAMARITFYYYNSLLEIGLNKEVAETCLANTPQFAAQWFFGEKSLKAASLDGAPF
jgi:hypothetical protein